jgi:hypothetical protein
VSPPFNQNTKTYYFKAAIETKYHRAHKLPISVNKSNTIADRSDDQANEASGSGHAAHINPVSLKA